jgi:hypothetical protein
MRRKEWGSGEGIPTGCHLCGCKVRHFDVLLIMLYLSLNAHIHSFTDSSLFAYLIQSSFYRVLLLFAYSFSILLFYYYSYSVSIVSHFHPLFFFFLFTFHSLIFYTYFLSVLLICLYISTLHFSPFIFFFHPSIHDSIKHLHYILHNSTYCRSKWSIGRVRSAIWKTIRLALHSNAMLIILPYFYFFFII